MILNNIFLNKNDFSSHTMNNGNASEISLSIPRIKVGPVYCCCNMGIVGSTKIFRTKTKRKETETETEVTFAHILVY